MESQNKRVLLVDDNPTNLQVLAQTLDGQGLELLIAQSGQEALDLAIAAKPAMILLDINMPEMDGYETCRRLKADPQTQDAMVVFLSARRDVEDKVKGLELGAIDFISKPFQIEEVIARVKGHMLTYDQQQQLKARANELEAQVAPRFQDLDADQLKTLIKQGETDRFELKSTLRWNLKANKPGKEIEDAWLKTVVAFLNTDGGILLVGVEDNGNILGLEPDQFKNEDRYMLHVNNLVRQVIGTDMTPFISFNLIPVHDKQVLCVQCLPAKEPAFLTRQDHEDFYIRVGPGSRKLKTSEVLGYVKNRFTEIFRHE